MDEFIKPANHINFRAKKLFGELGTLKIKDGSIAYIDLNGGGPTKLHTHTHNHLFIVIKGQAKIILDEKEIIVNENESYLVDGNIPHSVWNNCPNGETVMIGITVE